MKTIFVTLILILIVAFIGCRFPDFNRTLPNDPPIQPVMATNINKGFNFNLYNNCYDQAKQICPTTQIVAITNLAILIYVEEKYGK
jgi:hypothetical protein